MNLKMYRKLGFEIKERIALEGEEDVGMDVMVREPVKNDEGERK